MRKILFVGAEALPFAATGGLGDVLGSLPAEIQKCGGKDVDVRVIMPLYRAVGESFRAEMETIYELILTVRENIDTTKYQLIIKLKQIVDYLL